MKTLRFFGMAIVAVMLSAFATSCDDDDDDDNSQPATSEDGVVVNQKKLVKIVVFCEDSRYSDLYTTILRYDSKGRLIRWEEDDYDPDGSLESTNSQTYAWDENSITVHFSYYGDTGDYTFVLSDNMVTEMAGGSYPTTYQYDSDKRLAVETDKDGSDVYEYNYSWEDGQVGEAL